ncbi:MAG: hypothetical protein WA695_08820 [Candidatus Dormiibacterota bacterium]
MVAGDSTKVPPGRSEDLASRHPSRTWAWVRAVMVPTAITAWCLHPLVLPGFILQVDAVFGPRSPLSLEGVAAPLVLLSHLLGGALAGRVFVSGALFLCGFGPMVLLRQQTWLAQIPAALLGMLNPFVYDRLIEGQWGVAAALGILFLWLAFWEALQCQPGWKGAALCALAGWSAVVLDEHVVGVIVVLAGASLLWHPSWRNHSSILWGTVSFLILGAMLLYALPPFFLGHDTGSYYAVQHFGRPDLVEFRAASGSYGLWPNLVGLYGFWPERLGRIPLLSAGAPWWPVSTAVLVALAVAGALVRRERAWLLLAGLFGLAIAGSTATALGQDVFLWLMKRVPLVGAYREPQKWNELWLLAVVVLGAETLSWLARRPGPRWAADLAGLAAAVMVLAVIFPNGAGVLRELPATIIPVEYPPGWTQAASYLQDHVSPRTPVVVLPWSLYETLPFTGNLLTANPASVVFPGHLISPNDIQIPGVVTEASTPAHLAQVAINPRPPSCALQRTLRRLGVHWAIVEPAPGGNADAVTLMACGFRVRSGSLRALVLLHG